jgi:hypothetical protein
VEAVVPILILILMQGAAVMDVRRRLLPMGGKPSPLITSVTMTTIPSPVIAMLSLVIALLSLAITMLSHAITAQGVRIMVPARLSLANDSASYSIASKANSNSTR